jgi:hypothetical protein
VVTQTNQPRALLPDDQTNKVLGAELPEGEGKQVVIKVCGHCHGVETFSRMRISSAEWRVIVKDMQQRGASGSEQEMQAVLNYMGKYLARN